MNAPAHTPSLLGRIEAAHDRGKAVTFLDGDEPERCSWSRLHEDARRMAAALQARGAGPGERVALLGATSRQMLTAVEATWLTGAAVVVLPLSSRLGSPEEFRLQTRSRLEIADVTVTVGAPDVLPAAQAQPDDPSTVTLDGLQRHGRALGDEAYVRPPDDPDATAIVQFTSGSTAEPKGVVIPARCVLDNVDAAGERMPLDADDDVVVSWVPLYHDMGLVYMTANAMVHGAELVIAPPTRFVASPSSWNTWMSEFGGTWTIGPNFGAAISARLMRRAGALDLSRCRAWGSGSEPVQPDVMDALAAAGAEHGLHPGSLYAGYGMAEATVAISLPDAGVGFSTDVVDAEVLERGLAAEPVAPDDPRARRLAALRAPVARHGAARHRSGHRRPCRRPSARGDRGAGPVGGARVFPQPRRHRRGFSRRWLAAHG